MRGWDLYIPYSVYCVVHVVRTYCTVYTVLYMSFVHTVEYVCTVLYMRSVHANSVSCVVQLTCVYCTVCTVLFDCVVVVDIVLFTCTIHCTFEKYIPTINIYYMFICVLYRFECLCCK